MENLRVTGRDFEICSGCEACVDVCPQDCFSPFSSNLGNFEIDDFVDCDQCGKCLGVCAEDAIIYWVNGERQ